MKRLSLFLLAIILLMSAAAAEPIVYGSNTITFDIASMPTSALKEWLEALDPSYVEYKNIETMVFMELSKRGEIAWISKFKSTNTTQPTAAPTQNPSQSKSQINGVFVPDFQYFMETFFNHSQNIDKKMTKDFLEECKDGDKWVEHKAHSLFGGYDGISIRIVEGNGYLYTFRITIDKDDYKEQEDNFKAYVRAAAKGLLPHESDVFFGRFFETINYDYVLESPAGYISMYTNFDVYLVTLTKSSGEISIEFSLSLYQPE